MDDQSRSTRFRVLFESALQAYDKKTGIILAEHPLTLRLQNCHSIESIISLLQDQISSPSEPGGNDRVMASIKSTVSFFSSISNSAAFDWAIGLVRQKVLKAWSTSLTVLGRHSHLKMQYMLVSLSYLLYVPFSTSYVCIVVTSKCIRRPRTSILATIRLSTCSSQSNAFLDAYLPILRSSPQPPWTRRWSR
jgi:hypothetical protein